MPSSMQVVTVKKKFQIVIPQAIRERFAIEVGDLLEAAIHRGCIQFRPKVLVNRKPLKANQER